VDSRERFDAVSSGLQQFGFDFFMVDARTDVIVHASPWHIESEKDCNTFCEFASPFIPWEARQTAGAASTIPADKLYDLIVQGVSA
jgi:hypothetical protein